jgi:hypothetical protein
LRRAPAVVVALLWVVCLVQVVGAAAGEASGDGDIPGDVFYGMQFTPLGISPPPPPSPPPHDVHMHAIVEVGLPLVTPAGYQTSHIWKHTGYHQRLHRVLTAK